MSDQQLADPVHRRVEMLVAEGDFSKACQALLDESTLEPTLELLEAMEARHPQRNYCLDVSLKDESDRVVDFSLAEVQKALRSF